VYDLSFSGSGGTPVGTFTFGSGGCGNNAGVTSAYDITYTDNYYWTTFGTHQQVNDSGSSAGAAGGVWATIFNPNVGP